MVRRARQLGAPTLWLVEASQAPPAVSVLPCAREEGSGRGGSPLPEQPLGLPQLANHLLRRVPASLQQSSFLAHSHRREKRSQGSDRTQGVRPSKLGPFGE